MDLRRGGAVSRMLRFTRTVWRQLGWLYHGVRSTRRVHDIRLDYWTVQDKRYQSIQGCDLLVSIQRPRYLEFCHLLLCTFTTRYTMCAPLPPSSPYLFLNCGDHPGIRSVRSCARCPRTGAESRCDHADDA